MQVHESVNPANLSDVVTRVSLSAPEALVEACRVAGVAQGRWARVPAPGHFPMAVPSWYLVPALLAGNAVVWKPAEYAAACADALARVFAAGGLPPGLLTVVHADGRSTFDGLAAALAEGLVGKVGF